MMNTAAPIWDGNETWLVLGGAGLLAAFPKAYAMVLSALYLPVLLMLIALVFRGVAFEFRFKAQRGKPCWGAAFALGSMFAAFAQGVILGALVEGMPLQEGKYIGGAFGWFSPFSMLTGVAVVFGYALLGIDLADPQDRRPHAADRAQPDAAAGAGGGRVHGPGQRVAAVPGLADHGALVRGREFLVAVAGAAAGAGSMPWRCGARRCAKAAMPAPFILDAVLLRARFRRSGARASGRTSCRRR